MRKNWFEIFLSAGCQRAENIWKKNYKSRLSLCGEKCGKKITSPGIYLEIFLSSRECHCAEKYLEKITSPGCHCAEKTCEKNYKSQWLSLCGKKNIC